MAITQKSRNIKLTTPLGADKLLFRRMAFSESLGRLFEGRLQMLSEDHEIVIDELLGKPVCVELEDDEGTIRHFHAIVTNFGYAGEWRGLAAYEATLRPWFWLLTRTTDCRIFQEKSAKDIVDEILRDAGFSDVEFKLTASYKVREYCVQYRESDFNFISRLLEEEGIYYFFRHEQDKHVLVMGDDYSAHTSLDTVPYFPLTEKGPRSDEHVWSWAVSHEVRASDYVLDDFDFTKPKTDLEAKANISRKHAETGYEVYDYPGLYLETADGDTRVRRRVEEVQAEYSVARSDGCVKRLYTGGLFTLKDYPRSDQNQEYLLVSMTHYLEQDDYGPRESGGLSLPYRNSFTAVPSRTPYRPARRTPKPFVQGPQTAIVVGKSGEEIWTDQYGRVKVQFHWDRYGANDENSSCFVRVAQVWAGKQWGAMHIPRIGQEVIVDFLEGDPDRPIITGRVYNADNMPPYGLPDNMTQSGIKSRSTKQGTGDNFNELRFEDKKGEEEVYFHAEKNFTRIVENDDVLEVGMVKMDPGDQSMKIYNNQSLEVGKESGSGSQTVHVEKDRTTTVKTGKDDLTVKQDRSLTVESGNHMVTIKQGDQTMDIKAGKTLHKAAQSIELKVGGSSIKIEPAKITIKSTQIDIVGQASAKMKAATCEVNGSAMTTIKGGVVKIN